MNQTRKYIFKENANNFDELDHILRYAEKEVGELSQHKEVSDSDINAIATFKESVLTSKTYKYGNAMDKKIVQTLVMLLKKIIENYKTYSHHSGEDYEKVQRDMQLHYKHLLEFIGRYFSE